MLAENWNRPHGDGVIDPANFSPYPKNPVIAKFFKEIGRVDELGSGVRNTFKYSSIYIPGTEPELIEDDIFRTIIPLKSSSDTDTAQITTQIVELLRQDPTMSREKLLGHNLEVWGIRNTSYIGWLNYILKNSKNPEIVLDPKKSLLTICELLKLIIITLI